MNLPVLPNAIQPLLQAEHECFGYFLDNTDACSSCVVRALCQEQKDQNLADFSSEWERFNRLGARSEYLTVVTQTPCMHCRAMIRPDEGRVLYVAGKGTYHTRCVDLAFPPNP